MEEMASIYADKVIDEFIDDFMVGLIDLAHREGKVSKGMPKTKITFSPDTPSFLHELNDLSNTGYLTIEMRNGKGILEIKSSTPTKGKWSEWESGVPQYYYVQILSQFLATEYNFAYLFAALFAMNGSIILREYEFYREECKGDMEMLLSQATTFWNDCVIGNKFPTKQLVL